MPIDPQIPLMVQPPQAPANPLAQWEALQNMAALNEQRQSMAQERNARMQAEQQAQAQQAAMNQALQSTVDADGNVDVDAAAKLLTAHGLGSVAETLRTNHAKLVSIELDNRKKAADALSTDLQNLQRSASAVNDQGSWTAFRNEVARVKGPQYANAIPAQFSPENKLGLMTWFDDAKDSVSRQKLTLDAITEARQTNDPKKWTEAIASLSFLPQDRYQAALAEVKQVMPPTLKYLADAAKTPQDAANLGITPEQRQQSAQVAAGQALTASGQAETKRHNLEEERLAAQKAAADLAANDVGDLSPYVSTTASGRKYINLDDFKTPKQKKQAQDLAIKQGLPWVDSKTDAGLRAADAVQGTLDTILQQVEAKLPRDAQGRVIGGPENKLSKMFQTDPELAAFGAWRTGAIQTVQALAQPGMGLRINQAEINAAMNNDIPQITDTVATAQQRIKNLRTMLDNKERAALERDRQGGASASPSSGPKEGERREVPGHPGVFAVYRNGRWIVE